MKVPKPRKLKSGTWFIQLRLGGESIPVNGKTEKECIRSAQLIKAEYIAGKRDPKQVDPQSEVQRAPTLWNAIEDYIQKRDAVLSPSTIRGYKTIRRTRFVELMDRSLDDITDGDWQAACNNEVKVKNCSAKTLRNAWGFIASVIADTTGRQPPKVKLPQVVPNEHPFLEPEQIRPFIKAVQGTNVEIPALLALSSLRRSEIMGLAWEDIDFKKRLIRVSGAKVLDSDNKLVMKAENKNTSSNRVVPIMIDELYAALKRADGKTGPIIDYWPNVIWYRINQICEEHGFPLVGVHGLRHSFVSLAYHLGVPEKIVMEIGGWSDYQTMRKIYTHIARSDISRYTDQLTNFFSTEENANKSANE